MKSTPAPGYPDWDITTMPRRQGSLRWAAAPFRWFAKLPRRRQLMLLVVFSTATIATVGCAWLVWQRERQTQREQNTAEAWRRFNRAVELKDLKAAEALLSQLVEFTDREPAVEQRLAALRRGESQPGDTALAQLLLNEHLRAGRLPEAEREAAKIVEIAKTDMQARGVLARAALRSNRRDEARGHSAAVPSPFQELESASPGALLIMLQIKRELGEDDSEYRSFIATRLTPFLRTRDAEFASPEGKLQLLRCYHEVARDLDRFPDLAELWVPAAKLIAQLENDSRFAANLALAREEHLAVLYRLRRLKRLPSEEANALIESFEKQVADSWQLLHQRDERDPLPYVGLALACQRRGESSEALQWLDRGLKVSPDARELYLVLGNLLRSSDPLNGAAFLERAYEQYPDDLRIAQMLAELATLGGRMDRTRLVCRAVREKQPDLTWACRLEAAACLGMGLPTQAAEALAPIRPTLVSDAMAMELYVRAVCSIGADAAADELLQSEARQPREAEGHVGAARGYMALGRPEDAVRVAARVIERFSDHAGARTVHAEGLRLLAQTDDRLRWPAERVREAIAAYDWLRRRDPANRTIAQRIAWLELKGLESPELALKSIQPLREATSGLTGEMLETIGAVLLANGQTDAAMKSLSEAVQLMPGKASVYIHRAQAYARLDRRTDGLADLERASSLPRSPRESAEWQQVSDQVRGLK